MNDELEKKVVCQYELDNEPPPSKCGGKALEKCLDRQGGSAEKDQTKTEEQK